MAPRRPVRLKGRPYKTCDTVERVDLEETVQLLLRRQEELEHRVEQLEQGGTYAGRPSPARPAAAPPAPSPPPLPQARPATQPVVQPPPAPQPRAPRSPEIQ